MTAVPHPGDPVTGDAFGVGLLAALTGEPYAVVNERDDGFVDVDAADYLGRVEDDPSWSWIEPRLGGRILDIGAGGGRASVPLEEAGVDVTALDVSPGALEVCRRRGVTNRVPGSVTDLAATAAGRRWDTFLCMGNNLGLLGTPEGAREVFEALSVLGGGDCRLLGTMLNPYETTNPVHLAYHEANRARGDLPGQVWLRVRYQRLATPWFGLLWLAPDELDTVARAAGWELREATAGAIYAAELGPAR